MVLFQIILKILELIIKIVKVGFDIALTEFEFAVKIVIDAADPLVVEIGVEFTLVQLVEALDKVEVFVTRKVRCSMTLLILQEHENLEVAKKGKLNHFFDEALFAFAKSDFALPVIFQSSDLLNTLLAHF